MPVKSSLYATKRLKKLRENAGLTQEEFVSMMAVWLDKPISISIVQKWEQGKRPMKPEVVNEIAAYYKVEPKEFVERR